MMRLHRLFGGSTAVVKVVAISSAVRLRDHTRISSTSPHSECATPPAPSASPPMTMGVPRGASMCPLLCFTSSADAPFIISSARSRLNANATCTHWPIGMSHSCSALSGLMSAPGGTNEGATAAAGCTGDAWVPEGRRRPPDAAVGVAVVAVECCSVPMRRYSSPPPSMPNSKTPSSDAITRWLPYAASGTGAASGPICSERRRCSPSSPAPSASSTSAASIGSRCELRRSHSSMVSPPAWSSESELGTAMCEAASVKAHCPSASPYPTEKRPSNERERGEVARVQSAPPLLSVRWRPLPERSIVTSPRPSSSGQYPASSAPSACFARGSTCASSSESSTSRPSRRARISSSERATLQRRTSSSAPLNGRSPVSSLPRISGGSACAGGLLPPEPRGTSERISSMPSTARSTECLCMLCTSAT
mmetsp:Transcript_8820/g.22836  ORF Transcript_8820/g.22836 Transcript_8820/m.22836 type:complete len:422 (-) Transcript_8820:2395-3660(-)